MKNKKIKIISICGIKRSGKDTIAEYLIKKNNFKRYSFADPIKQGLIKMFGFTEKQMWGDTEDKEAIDPRWGISPRKMMQIVGTELFQFDIHKHLKSDEFPVGREVWVHRFKLWCQEEKNRSEKDDVIFKIVIADVRYPHEANAIRDMGGEIWRVERPSLTNVDFHPSEMEVDNIKSDITFINDGTLNDLYNKVDVYLSTNLQLSK